MIPKKIHYCWFGNTPLPKQYQQYIDGWKKLCPDYEIICWNETNYDIHKNRYMEQAYEEKKWSFVSDYAGFDVVYEYGGIYLDTDVELVKNLDSLLNENGFFGMETNEEGVFVAPGLGFGAAKADKIIKGLRDMYEGIRFIKKNGELNTIAIPVYATKYLVQSGFEKRNELQKIEGIMIYPTEYFAPMDFLTGKVQITEKTYSIHHYSALWQDERSRVHTEIIRRNNRRFGKKWGMKLNLFLRIGWGVARRVRSLFRHNN
ncbi:glycosyltransferase family 32 protein [Liquorilactobacillus oeni]|uniref:Glycosyltransferase n=1 Tax=Liquorilactobacillus oeni DSM 19972 TaxID=1423777 RepID=A0A0R1MKM3_9LACO|nr:glycosyltransferase [Liquorilactobacillus oeni]KRL05067.1 glycosyltransferase [Liquorilactobacillus oeni DSM 19972]